MFLKRFVFLVKSLVACIVIYFLAYTPTFASQTNPCFPIYTISFASLDSYLYHADEEKKLIYSAFPFITSLSKPYLNQCLNAQDIATLLKSLNDSAIKKGYLTTRFGIGKQDLTTGILDIKVQLGKIGEIDYQSNGYMFFFKKDFSIKQGDLLNFKSLESGISNLTRIKHLDTTMQILPAFSENVSDIQIRIKKKDKPFSLQFIFDNGGTLFEGYEATLLFNYENPFHLADILTLYFLGSIPFEDKQISKNYNFYSSLSYSVPIRRFMLETNFAAVFNALEIPLANFNVGYESRSYNLDTKLSYAILANPKHNISFGIGFGARISDSFIEKVELLVQRQRLLQYSLFAQYTLSLNQYRFNANISLMQGFALPSPVTQSFNFIVPVINFYGYVPFGVWKYMGVYTTSLKTQVAQNRLYANDQMLIGGRYTVRGFDRMSFSGQLGVLYRNDLAFYFPAFGKNAWRVTFAPSIGFDMGYVRDLFQTSTISSSPNLQNGILLCGGGIGLQTITRYLNAQVWWYFPLYSQYQANTQSFFFALAANW